MKRGKKYVEAAKAIDRTALYDPAEAIALAKKVAVAKFDETIEAHIRTGCDGRHADQQIRGAVVLPHGTGSYTGYDGRCRTSGTCTRTERFNAEPESRNGYYGCDKGSSGYQSR